MLARDRSPLDVQVPITGPAPRDIYSLQGNPDPNLDTTDVSMTTSRKCYFRVGRYPAGVCDPGKRFRRDDQAERQTAKRFDRGRKKRSLPGRSALR
jgi:hypothetical protein